MFKISASYVVHSCSVGESVFSKDTGDKRAKEDDGDFRRLITDCLNQLKVKRHVVYCETKIQRDEIIMKSPFELVWEIVPNWGYEIRRKKGK